MPYLIRDLRTGEYSTPDSLHGTVDDIPAGEDVYFESFGLIPEGVNPDAAIADENGNIVEHPNPPHLWDEIRRQRGALLFVTDGTQATDRPDDYRDYWAAYRAQLRDITGVQTLRDVVWPTPPDEDELNKLMTSFKEAARRI